MSDPTSPGSSFTDGIARITAFKTAHLALAPPNSFAAPLWPPLTILSASLSTSRAAFSTTFDAMYGNHSKTAVHGGAIATLLDSLTGCTLALIAERGYWDGKEVTRSLQLTYFLPVPVGEKVLIETEIVSAGKRLASVRGVLRRESDGVVLVCCAHEKFYPGERGKL